MNGLEISEILLSEVFQNNRIHRYDAEYFVKQAILVDKKIKSKEHFFIDSKKVVSGPFGSTLKSSEYLEKGEIPFIRIENIKSEFTINKTNMGALSSVFRQVNALIRLMLRVTRQSSGYQSGALPPPRTYALLVKVITL